MRIFLAFVAKEFIYILRDRRTSLILLLLPVVQVVLFGYALNTDVNNVKISIFNQSNDPISARIVSDISHNPYFSVIDYSTSIVSVETLLRQGKIDLALVIPPSLMENIVEHQRPAIQLIVDASNPNTARISENYVTAIAMSALPRVGTGALPYQIDVLNRMLFNPSVQSTYSFVPGIVGLVLIIICSVMTSVSIVREKEQGSMEVLLASPLRPFSMLLAKMVPYIVFSIINLISILLLAHFLMHVPIRGSLLLLFVFSLIYIMLSLAVGLLVSTLVSNQASAIMLTGIGMMMPTLLLSGLIFPIPSMPDFLQWISYGVPARWYIEGLKQIMIQGVGWFEVWKHIVVLLSMTLFFSIFNLKSLKLRLD